MPPKYTGGGSRCRQLARVFEGRGRKSILEEKQDKMKCRGLITRQKKK